MLNFHQFLHNEYGLCLWTILTVIILLIGVVFEIIHLHKQSKRKKDFDKEVQECYSEAPLDFVE